MRSTKVQRATFVLIALAGATIDLVTKSLVFARVTYEVTVINGCFSLVATRNTGTAFGLGRGYGWVFLLLSGAAIIAIPAWYFLQKHARWAVAVALGLILAGAIGNSVDRVTGDGVRDWLKFYWGSRVFPHFNVADSCVFCGAVTLLVESFFIKKPGKLTGGSEGG